jgi:hypothetical protein
LDWSFRSQVFHQTAENECYAIVEKPATTQVKEETTSSLRAMDVGASTTLGTSAHINWKKKTVVVHLDWLAPYQGTAQDEQP